MAFRGTSSPNHPLCFPQCTMPPKVSASAKNFRQTALELRLAPLHPDIDPASRGVSDDDAHPPRSAVACRSGANFPACPSWHCFPALCGLNARFLTEPPINMRRDINALHAAKALCARRPEARPPADGLPREQKNRGQDVRTRAFRGNPTSRGISLVRSRLRPGPKALRGSPARNGSCAMPQSGR